MIFDQNVATKILSFAKNNRVRDDEGLAEKFVCCLNLCFVEFNSAAYQHNQTEQENIVIFQGGPYTLLIQSGQVVFNFIGNCD